MSQIASVSLSVRELVEFILASGSIDNRGGGDLYQRANEGARLHRKLQKRSRSQYGEIYQPEVTLSDERKVDGVVFHIYGRADAILDDPEGPIIEEIKTTELALTLLSDQPEQSGYNPLHWAQATCYAFILAQQRQLPEVRVRLIYCQLETEETISFTHRLSFEQLSQFYLDLLARYHRWAMMRFDWEQLRNRCAKQLAFPFSEYRAGQRQMAAVIYRAAENGSRVLCQAPTGIGKTISSLFPSIKALGEGKLSHIFYLTAKNSTRLAAEEAFARMQEKGLRLRRVSLTAKDRICFLPERLCNPDDCPYAKGYYDRVPDVLFEMLKQEDAFTRPVIERWAKQRQLCPFELGLDLSLWCDAVICDYNYLFDPIVYLRRFFDHRDRYAFLIDEAHNLVDRARGMYSAALRKSDFLACKKLADEVSKPLSKALMAVNRQMLSLRKQIAQDTQQEQEHFMTAHTLPEPLLQSLRHLFTVYFTTLEQNRRLPLQPSLFSSAHSLAPELMQLYFDLRFFLRIADLFDERFCFFAAASGSQLTVKLLCLDPAQMVDERLKLGRCTALFSATLSPPSYYKAVLGCDSDEQTHSYALPSPFVQEKLCLLVCNQINTRWAMREQSLEPIAQLLFEMVSAKAGNYIAYFPSYQYLQKEAEVFSQLYPQLPLVLQSPQEDDFLAQFDQPHPERSLLGFAVLGGIYSEGVDLQGEKLLGCAIIGTGLPKVGAQQEILREYFQQKNNSGYDFAYRFPGMNKVLQAAGRVIRSPQDRGVVLLLDDRFTTAAYQRLFPAHWSHARILSDSEQLRQTLCTFWESQADNNG